MCGRRWCYCAFTIHFSMVKECTKYSTKSLLHILVDFMILPSPISKQQIADVDVNVHLHVILQDCN